MTLLATSTDKTMPRKINYPGYQAGGSNTTPRSWGSQYPGVEDLRDQLMYEGIDPDRIPDDIWNDLVQRPSEKLTNREIKTVRRSLGPVTNVGGPF